MLRSLVRGRALSASAGFTPNPAYHLCQTSSEINDALNELLQAPSFAFDTETTGLDVKESKPIGVSFSTGVNKSYYIPVFAGHLTRPGALSSTEVIKSIRQLFVEAERNMKIAHNIKFDLQMLTNIGIEVKGEVFDTMIAGFLLDSSEPYSLDAMSLKHLGITKIPTSQLIGKGAKQISMTQVDLDLLAHYACEDASCTHQLFDLLQPKLQADPKLHSFFTHHEMPVARILAKMEQTGVYVDQTILGEISAQLTQEMEATKQRIFTEAKEEFNLNSTKQLSEILFDKLDVPKYCGVELKKKSSKSGAFSLDISVLKTLSKHPVVADVIQYRSLSKLLSTVDGLPKLVTSCTGRIHPTFKQCGTVTGRLSCSQPNMQNVPVRTDIGRKIRSAFAASGDDRRIIAADYSQIELRIVAFLAKDKNLTQIFIDGGDVHQSTAAIMFKKDLAEVTKEDRSRAKAINYGIIYGMGPSRLAATTGVTTTEANRFIRQYFKGFPQMKTFFDQNLELAKQDGFVRTFLGRKRPVDFDGDGKAKNHAKNITSNTPIQGSAADLITTAMIQIDQELAASKYDGQMLLQVHDELVFECSQADEPNMIALIKKGMVENSMSLGDVPIEVDIRSGRNWMEAH
ncbi:DNA polymerase I [Batrachochytrium salamandrivorans]|nr:DNA polymerase I [Batrachochytrium salamandrivorans]